MVGAAFPRPSPETYTALFVGAPEKRSFFGVTPGPPRSLLRGVIKDMNTYVSMLRGINVGGKKRIQMQQLVALYESLGLSNVRTYVQSGNVVFDSAAADASRLARLIEEGITKTFGFSAAVVIRTKDELRRIVESNPFLKDNEIDIDKLHVTFLSGYPHEAGLDQARAAGDGSDSFVVLDREVYLHCPNGYGRTKLSNDFFEKKLKVTGTTRNWRTVTALLQIVGG